MITNSEVKDTIEYLYNAIEKVNTLPDSRYKKTALFNLKEAVAELTILNIDISLNLI